MSTKPSQKKTPFIVEPLDWVAPDSEAEAVKVERDEREAESERQPEQAGK